MKKRIVILLAALMLLAFALDQRLEVCTYSIQSEKIDGDFTLAVVSDLHNSFYGKNQEKLIAAIRKQNPDALAMIGDMAGGMAETDGMCALVAGLQGEMPVYYVSGNHEMDSGEAGEIKQLLRDMGVRVLEGESDRIGGVRIVGLDDPAGTERKIWRRQAEEMRAQDDVFTILLSHRPVQTIYYALHKGGYDLILSGHAHGGQIRIPRLMNGIWAPDEGLFPEYAAGQYELQGAQLDTSRGAYHFDTAQMIVSRGLCKNWMPRVFNRTEVTIVKLSPQ